jgi:Arc/MetJ-type ribon-helix-helix transcriptional regulator
MKKKVFTRPVSVVLSDEMFDQIKTITDKGEIGLSDYIREAIQEKLASEKYSNNNDEQQHPERRKYEQ